MRQKTVSLDCDAHLANSLALAVRAYAEAAYPSGGSECAQVARAALVDVAALCEAHSGGHLVLRRRLMPQVRAAVRWCLSQDGPAHVEFAPGLESVLEIDAKSTR